MLAHEVISQECPILKPTDKVERVLQWMDEYRVMHMPVFDGSEYLGLISEADLLTVSDSGAELGQAAHLFLEASIAYDRPIYEVIKLMDDLKLSIIPVMDERKRLMGTIGYKEILSAMVGAFNLSSPGGVLVLEMNYVDYALSEISRIVESNDARVMSAHISFHDEGQKIDVILKVNTESLTAIIQTLERYDYSIKASFGKGEDNDYLQDRYEELMRYLNT